MKTYLNEAKNVYKHAALEPDIGLCCTTTPVWQLPGLSIPGIMLEMNYGCGSTVHPRDLVNEPTVLYVGVGGGMELLQFAYFSRREGAIIGIDIVDEMLTASAKNMNEAQQLNDWFDPSFIHLKRGEATQLPLPNEYVDVAAQNCLFNIFKKEELDQALTEMYRVLKPHGRLVLSDPICETEIPENLRNDDRLRALCLTGCLTLNDYIKSLTDVGFGTIEIRARRPYRILDPMHYDTSDSIFIESVEVCAIKDPMPEDGPCVFTGRTAIYYGQESFLDDQKGHVLVKNQPLAVCDKTANALISLGRSDIYVSPSTFFYDGGGCC